jgi:peptidoglycan/LPS O-acetylase OafA/YrhL
VSEEAIRPHFALFDALRGLAVLAVVAFHVSSITGNIGLGVSGRLAEVLGAQAVALFYVISAFLLYRPYVAARVAGRPRPSAWRFARRRVRRIVPAYWTALTVLAIYPGIVGVFSGSFWRYYGFLQLYSHETLGRGIPVAWTLCVEVSFYALLPLWALLAARLPWWRGELAALAVVAAAGVAVQLAAARLTVSDLWAAALPGQLPWLATGMALAVASVLAPPWLERAVAPASGRCWLVALGALAGLMALVPDGGLAGLVAALGTPQSLHRTAVKLALSLVLCAALTLPVVFGSGGGGLPRRVLRLRPVAWIGTLSYSLYLYHLTIAELLGLRADPLHFSQGGLGLAAKIDQGATPVLLLATLAVTIPVAALSYRFVERPFFHPH